MIPVTGFAHVRGIGYCRPVKVHGSMILIQYPHDSRQIVFDVYHGLFRGPHPDEKFPYMTARFVSSEDNRLLLRRSTSYEEATKRDLYAREDEWKEDLALDVFPTVCSSIVRMIIEGREAVDVEKTMVDYVKVKVKKLQSDGSFHFYLTSDPEKEVTLDQCLNEITLKFRSDLGLSFQPWSKDELDESNSRVKQLFDKRRPE